MTNEQTWLPSDLTPEMVEALQRMKPTYQYVDSVGVTISASEAIERARAYIIKYGSIHDVIDVYLENALPEDIVRWLVDPITGEFVDDD